MTVPKLARCLPVTHTTRYTSGFAFYRQKDTDTMLFSFPSFHCPRSLSRNYGAHSTIPAQRCLRSSPSTSPQSRQRKRALILPSNSLPSWFFTGILCMIHAPGCGRIVQLAELKRISRRHYELIFQYVPAVIVNSFSWKTYLNSWTHAIPLRRLGCHYGLERCNGRFDAKPDGTSSA